MCGAPTAGPFAGGGKSITTGQAAHICAAAEGGPRFDSKMTVPERKHYDNGIWLCAAHSPLVDHNWPHYTVEQLREMKRRAEAKAHADLAHAKAIADLRAVLEDGVRWSPPSPHETRPGYQDIWHVVFRLASGRKERARATIEVVRGKDRNEHQACISRDDNRLRAEWRDIRHGEPCRIPVFVRAAQPTAFWLDRHLRLHQNEASLAPGTYITDRPFIDHQSRTRLSGGRYRIRVRLILGDSAHTQSFYSEWKPVVVPR